MKFTTLNFNSENTGTSVINEYHIVADPDTGTVILPRDTIEYFISTHQHHYEHNGVQGMFEKSDELIQMIFKVYFEEYISKQKENGK